MPQNAGMLYLVKRLAVFAGIVSICFFLLTFRSRVSHGARPGIKSSCPLTPPKIVHTPVEHGRFNWRNITTKHPVQSYNLLSTTKPQFLPRIQHNFGKEALRNKIIRQTRKASVKEAFQRGWASYKENAWMNDELMPLSGGSKNPFGGWGATLVDSLDTLWIMDMKDEFELAVAAAVQIDTNPATQAQEKISIFETTIRYLGGFLAAYDLTDCKDKRLLDKAVEIADMLYTSFDTPNRMPVSYWNPRLAVNGEDQASSPSSVLADIASSSLEFTRLSQLTGDMRYFDAISRITHVLDEQQNKTKLPGMWPVTVDVLTPNLTTGGTFSLGAMSDSAYEYLPKTYQLLGDTDQSSQYRRMYEYAMETMINHLLYRPMAPDSPDILMPGIVHAEDPENPFLENNGQHLSCFVGAMLALGGKLTQNTTHVELGRKVTDSCIWAYKSSPLGIMPEWFKLSACPTHAPCPWAEDAWSEEAQPGLPSGFMEISDPRYILRPEAIESVFYLYRITGEQKYQDAAWEMWQAIDKATKTTFANAAVKDVTKVDGGLEDSMESFWMAETLKYFYLIFSESDVISLDDYVFNTEAHPFKLRNRT